MTNKRPYNYIETWKRKAIIDCALNKTKSIKKCAKELGVKYITAKHIVKVYKTTGRIETKCGDKSKSRRQEQDFTSMCTTIKSSGSSTSIPSISMCDYSTNDVNCGFGQGMSPMGTQIHESLRPQMPNTQLVNYSQGFMPMAPAMNPMAFYQVPNEFVLVPIQYCSPIVLPPPCREVSNYLGGCVFQSKY